MPLFRSRLCPQTSQAALLYHPGLLLHHPCAFLITKPGAQHLRSNSSKTIKVKVPEIDIAADSFKQSAEDLTLLAKDGGEELRPQEPQSYRNCGRLLVNKPTQDTVANHLSATDLTPEPREPPLVSGSVFRKHFIVDKSHTDPKPTQYIPKPRADAHPGFVYTKDFDLFQGGDSNGDGIVTVVEIGNPHTANCLSSATLRKLTKVFTDLSKRKRLRVVILTGCQTTATNKPPVFSAGADIKEMEALSTEHEAQAFISHVFTACESIRKCPVPVIARIDGGCFGAAIELAACCDFRYSTAGSRFGMKEVALGVPSVVQARLLANIIGWQETKKMVLLAQDQNAPYMTKIGFLDGSYQTLAFLDHQIDRIVNVIATNAPKATRAQKILNRFWEENPLKQGLVQGIETFAQTWGDGGSEPKQYMRAWLDRGKSTISGRSKQQDTLSEKEVEAEITEKELEKPTSWNFLKLRTYLGDSKR